MVTTDPHVDRRRSGSMQETMSAGCMPAPGKIAIGEFAVPVPRDGQLLVRMRWAAICGSDVHRIFDGLHEESSLGRPGYPGHEGVGEVVASFSPLVAAGTNVLLAPAAIVGGCFAEYQVIDAGSVVPIPATLDLRRAVLAQQLGTTIFAMKRFETRSPARRKRCVVVIGAGAAGLFFVQQMASAGGEHLVVSDPSRPRLDVAARLGATRVVTPPEESVVDVVMGLTRGRGADLVIEAVGYDACRAEAVACVRPNGTIGVFGFPQQRGMAPFPTYAAFRKSADVRFTSGTQGEPGLRSFRQALVAIESGAIEVDYCLTHEYPLEGLVAAFDAARSRPGEAVKRLIRIGSEATLEHLGRPGPR